MADRDERTLTSESAAVNSGVPTGPLSGTGAELQSAPAFSTLPSGESASTPADAWKTTPGTSAVGSSQTEGKDSLKCETPTATRTPGGRRSDLPACVGQYRVEEEIARGGMGRVLRIRDDDFDRPLAMKVLLERRGDLEERLQPRITGLLQHPGIPPVHALGKFDDGRPFFVMKLIQGRSLQALLRERLSPEADLARFVAIFEQICQTVGYAHARGVIHRDLKPGNIMVGAFGEVQVMDWGLAKLIRSQAREEQILLEGSATVYGLLQAVAAGNGTQPGSLLGTPAYMAPEQARGELDAMDASTDVFGLGAVLCEILTGAPPYRGEDPREIVRKAALADLSEPLARLNESKADSELVQLARRSLMKRKEDRPTDGAAVAQAIAAYRAELDQRLRQAEIDRAAAEARTEEEYKRRQAEQARADEEHKRREVEQAKAKIERRRRRTVGLLAGSLLVIVVGGIWFTFNLRNERDKRKDSEEGLKGFLENYPSPKEQEVAKYHRTLEYLERIEKNIAHDQLLFWDAMLRDRMGILLMSSGKYADAEKAFEELLRASKQRAAQAKHDERRLSDVALGYTRLAWAQFEQASRPELQPDKLKLALKSQQEAKRIYNNIPAEKRQTDMSRVLGRLHELKTAMSLVNGDFRNEELAGLLRPHDPRDDKANTRSRIYPMKLAAGKTYQIDFRPVLVEGRPYSPGYLRLEDKDGRKVGYDQMSLIGEWIGSEKLASFGRLRFRFEDKNIVLMADAKETTTGTYEQKGAEVSLSFYKNMVRYKGVFNGKVLSGSATNGDRTWTFSVSPVDPGNIMPSITFDCHRAGLYRLVAGMMNGEGGEYVLNVAPVHQLGKGSLKIEDRLHNSDAKVEIVLPEGPRPVYAKLYNVKLFATRSYRVTLGGDPISSVLFIQDRGGNQLALEKREDKPAVQKQANLQQKGVADLKANSGKALKFAPARTDIYRIFVGATEGAGNFALNVNDVGYAGPEGIQEVGDGLTIAGALNHQNQNITYRVKLERDKTYRIDLLSSNSTLDPYLILLDADGKRLADDDDSAGNLNARLIFSPPRTGIYQVMATSCPLPCVKARNGAFKFTVHPAVAGTGLNFGALDDRKKSIDYEIRLEAAKSYVIDMISPNTEALDPYLRLLDPAGREVAKDDDGGRGLNARIIYQAQTTGNYRIVAMSSPMSVNGAHSGPFTLTVSGAR